MTDFKEFEELDPEWDKSRRPGPVEVSCDQCGAAFTVSRYAVSQGDGRYCSRECFAESQRKIHPRPCEVCGEEYLPHYQSQRACSQKCARVLTQNRVDKACVVCGTVFTRCAAHAERGDTCSKQCYGELRKRNRPHRGVCKYCGLEWSCPEWEWKSSRAYFKDGYCSQACKVAANPTKATFTCKACGKEFEKHINATSGTIYCSKRCAATGAANPRSNFTYDDVVAIKQALSAGVPQVQIADQYGVKPVIISHIRCGRTWADVPWPNGKAPKVRHRITLTQGDRDRIVGMRRDGASVQEILTAFPQISSRETIYSILRKHD